MMFKALATATLALGVATHDSVRTAAAAEQGAMSDSTREHAEQRAREALAQRLNVAQDAVTVQRSEPHTWTDSSMGCGKPGNVALTVITEGYVVVLSAQGAEHSVHVSGDNVVVCDRAAVPQRSGGVANARGLDVMMEQARQDLAQRLGVEPAKIRLAGMEPHRWDDSALGCPQLGETVQPGPVDGFRLMLKYSGRVYTYHTDRRTVRACPAIEAG
jgi:hypothetical protein